MATAFKISNGDVVVNNSTGRPKLIGNPLNETNREQSRLKTSQDLRRCLSINSIIDGSGAGLFEIIGNTDTIGITSTQILLNKRIRQMFAAVLRLQNQRLGVRPSSERFSNISLLRIFTENNDQTIFRFRLDVRTRLGNELTLSGLLG
jgi:hypothetical protein